MRLLGRHLRLLVGALVVSVAMPYVAHADDEIKISDDDEDEDEPAPKKKKKHADDEEEDRPKKKKKHVEDEEEDRPKKKKKKADDDEEDNGRRRKLTDSDPSDSGVKKKKATDEEEEAPKKKKVKEEDEEEDEAPARKKKVTAKRKDELEEEEAPKKKAKKKVDDEEEAPKKKAKKVVEEEDEAPKKKAKKVVEEEDEPPKKAKKKVVEEEDEPAPKKLAKKKVEEDEAPKKKSKKAVELAGDDEIEMESDSEPRVEAAPLPGTEVEAVDEGPQLLLPPIDERSLTTRKGKLELHVGLPINVLTLPTATPGMTTTTTSEALALGMSYGIDKGELGLDYALGINPGAVKGPLTIHGAYIAKSTPKYDVAVAAALAVDFVETTNTMTMTTISTTLVGLQIGAWARYRLAPRISLFTGLPALPNSTVSLKKLALPLPPIPYQLVVGLNNAGSLALELPIGIGWQTKPNIYVFSMFNLANIRISNTVNAIIFKDFIPFSLGGFYTREKIDFGATLGLDLKQGTNYLNFALSGRYNF